MATSVSFTFRSDSRPRSRFPRPSSGLPERGRPSPRNPSKLLLVLPPCPDSALPPRHERRRPRLGEGGKPRARRGSARPSNGRNEQVAAESPRSSPFPSAILFCFGSRVAPLWGSVGRETSPTWKGARPSSGEAAGGRRLCSGRRRRRPLRGYRPPRNASSLPAIAARAHRLLLGCRRRRPRRPRPTSRRGETPGVALLATCAVRRVSLWLHSGTA